MAEARGAPDLWEQVGIWVDQTAGFPDLLTLALATAALVPAAVLSVMAASGPRAARAADERWTGAWRPTPFAAAVAERHAPSDAARQAPPTGAAGARDQPSVPAAALAEATQAPTEEAVARWRADLAACSRDDEPLRWAAIQNNLGAALTGLGGQRSDPAWLQTAVQALEAALEERTRARVPREWATTQHNLGNALACLGGRQASTASLHRAVAAFRAALQERTRERDPLAWAATHNDLGNALWALGEREEGVERLKEAVAAFRAALAERTREREPLAWAATQNNLGNVLATLGERERDTARLEDAVAAFRASLGERTRELAPMDWAVTQNNLGSALAALAEREGESALLDQAILACGAALDVFEAARADDYAQIARGNIDFAKSLLAHWSCAPMAAERGR